MVADTEAHAAYYRERFGLASGARRGRLGRRGGGPVPPAETERPEFHVLFVGKLIPLHGLETILAAARLVPDVPFVIAGEGQLAPLLSDRPANVEHVPWIDYRDLPAAYRRAGCALGIFGAGEKAARVIPNKVFQALACARPVITADTRPPVSSSPTVAMRCSFRQTIRRPSRRRSVGSSTRAGWRIVSEPPAGPRTRSGRPSVSSVCAGGRSSREP